MHDDRAELRSVGVSEVIGVEDASSAIVVGVDEDDDMLVGDACQHVVQFLQVEGSQIAVAIERVEMRAEDRILPDAFRRPAGAVFLGGGHNGNHIEAVLHLMEWFMRKERFHRHLAVLDECVHFVLLIPLSHIGHMDTTGGVGSLL